MPHIKFKPTKRIAIDFDPSELDFNAAPEESKKQSREYVKSNKLSEGDIMLMLDNEVIFAFDYVFGKEKILIPEINPVTIFYSNALMSHRLLYHYKEKLLHDYPTVKKFRIEVNPSDFGNFFQLASNTIINLQATIESLANRLIPSDQTCIGKDGESFEPSLFHKINIILPEIKGVKFKTVYGKQNNLIRQLIELRNEIIHLKPAQNTNTKYKEVYRRLINFKFTETILAVRIFVDFYDQNLIEECPCGKEFYYDSVSVE